MVDKLLDRESLLLRLNKAQWDEIFTSNISHPPDFFIEFLTQNVIFHVKRHVALKIF